MPSANTVAQKPAGSVNPVSSPGQDEFFVWFAEFDWLRVETDELSRQNTATQNRSVPITCGRRIEPSAD
jgi:hypothetical protein